MLGGERQHSAFRRSILYVHIGFQRSLISGKLALQRDITSQDHATSVRDQALSKDSVRSWHGPCPVADSTYAWNTPACALCIGTASPPLPPSASRPPLRGRQDSTIHPQAITIWELAMSPLTELHTSANWCERGHVPGTQPRSWRREFFLPPSGQQAGFEHWWVCFGVWVWERGDILGYPWVIVKGTDLKL